MKRRNAYSFMLILTSWILVAIVSADSNTTSISFPSDHGLHPEHLTEWWYVTANLEDEFGNNYGIQFTLFSTAENVGDQTRRVYFGHSALSTSKNFYFAERHSRANTGYAGIEDKPWRAFIDDWVFQGTGEAPLPGVIEVNTDEFSFTLSLSDATYFLQGDNGFSKKDASGTITTYYYSAPFISIEGNLSFNGKHVAVAGTGWLDREWSSSLFLAEGVGWDWFSIRLNNNETLMLFNMRTGGKNYMSGSLMKRDGDITTISSDKISLAGRKYKVFDKQPYAMEWSIKIPEHGIDIVTTPLFEDQYLRTTVRYWEGAIRANGTHDAVGYIEMFGER